MEGRRDGNRNPFERFQSVVEGVIATINTTDIKRRKDEIKQRFAKKNKEINLEY